MIEDSKFQSGRDNKEILPMNSAEFPYVCKYTIIDRYIPWHWHPSLEINYVIDGEAELKTPGNVFHIQKGELCFVNSGIMHEMRTPDHVRRCRIYTHLFEMDFLSGIRNSVFEQKYLFPIIKCRELESFLIRPDSYQRICMAEKALKIVELCKEERFGYEFDIRSALCDFWKMLLEETSEIRSRSTEKKDYDISRMKQMLQYIHDYYMEKITLEHIAAAASISPRECVRCFRRCIQASPVNYLNEYRIRMAAQMLLNTKESITVISESCGFSSSSYFGKMFCRAMGCTPKEYRRGTT